MPRSAPLMLDMEHATDRAPRHSVERLVRHSSHSQSPVTDIPANHQHHNEYQRKKSDTEIELTQACRSRTTATTARPTPIAKQTPGKNENAGCSSKRLPTRSMRMTPTAGSNRYESRLPNRRRLL